MFGTQRLFQITGIALVLGGIGLVTAGTAGAVTSAADAAFLADIRAEGIDYESAGDVIADAYRVCTDLDAGVTAADIGLDIMEYTDLSVRQTAAFMVNAIDYYCPEHVGAFG